MISKTAFFLAVVIGTAVNCDPIFKNIELVNEIQDLWTAGYNDLSDKSIEYKKRLCGVLDSQPEKTLPVKEDIEIFDSIPASFDARLKWPNCPSIDSIKNQGLCGSCWAVGATSSFSDRLCIASNSQIKVNISTEDLITCSNACVETGGCDGGYPDKAWLYIKNTGLVTGGDYGSNEGCQPYQIVPTSDYYTPPCKKRCTNDKYGKPYNKDKHYVKKAYLLPTKNVKAIQSEILKNGPLEVIFMVYDDLFHYKSGVYKPTTPVIAGRHAVRIIGWGKEKSTPYWLVANSWGRGWGENGFFKIVRGANECGIEEYPMAGLPKL